MHVAMHQTAFANVASLLSKPTDMFVKVYAGATPVQMCGAASGSVVRQGYLEDATSCAAVVHL